MLAVTSANLFKIKSNIERKKLIKFDNGASINILKKPRKIIGATRIVDNAKVNKKLKFNCPNVITVIGKTIICTEIVIDRSEIPFIFLFLIYLFIFFSRYSFIFLEKAIIPNCS